MEADGIVFHRVTSLYIVADDFLKKNCLERGEKRAKKLFPHLDLLFFINIFDQA
jgi:hypothetical protein